MKIYIYLSTDIRVVLFCKAKALGHNTLQDHQIHPLLKGKAIYERAEF